MRGGKRNPAASLLSARSMFYRRRNETCSIFLQRLSHFRKRTSIYPIRSLIICALRRRRTKTEPTELTISLPGSLTGLRATLDLSCFSTDSISLNRANLMSYTPLPIEKLSINTIRTLSMDAVQAANSGHPGTPMALAPAAYVIFNEICVTIRRSRSGPIATASCFPAAMPRCCSMRRCTFAK